MHMTTYRVGAAGATVFDLEGLIVCRLRPGTVVVIDHEITSRDATAQALDRAPQRL